MISHGFYAASTGNERTEKLIDVSFILFPIESTIVFLSNETTKENDSVSEYLEMKLQWDEYLKMKFQSTFQEERTLR